MQIINAHVHMIENKNEAPDLSSITNISVYKDIKYTLLLLSPDILFNQMGNYIDTIKNLDLPKGASTNILNSNINTLLHGK